MFDKDTGYNPYPKLEPTDDEAHESSPAGDEEAEDECDEDYFEGGYYLPSQDLISLTGGSKKMRRKLKRLKKSIHKNKTGNGICTRPVKRDEDNDAVYPPQTLLQISLYNPKIIINNSETSVQMLERWLRDYNG